jgi:hypothetical protein
LVLCKKKNKEAIRVPTEKSDFCHARLRTLLIFLLLGNLDGVVFFLNGISLLGDSTALDTTTLLEYIDESILVNGLEVPLGDLLLPVNYTLLAFLI